MKSLVSSMAVFPKAFIAAIVRSILRGKSWISILFTFWSSPSPIPPPSTAGTLPPRSIAEFLKEAEDLILGAISHHEDLLRISAGLKKQFQTALSDSEISMLPSYTYRLPTGHEKGQFLALDMGGTTLRIALVELRGRGAESEEKPCKVLHTNILKAEEKVKDLVGIAFFEWMAEMILETVSSHLDREDGKPLPIAVTWSFPLEQKSIKNGIIHDMGKGFHAANGLIGQDLGEVIKSACKTKGLDVELQAILNDSTACLLSQAYVDPSTRLGLILGTGCNLAAFVPVSSIPKSKYGGRPASWFDEARHVVINSELGMYGKDVLPLTRWDMELKKGHEKPWFQPLEHMVSGMYLGECCRIPLVEAIETTGIFGGVVPAGLQKPYGLRTETLALIAADPTPTFETALPTFNALYPSTIPATPADLKAVASIASFITRRSTAIIAASVFALWQLRNESSLAHREVLTLPDSRSAKDSVLKAEIERESLRTTVSYNGAVIESYPGYLPMCQTYLDALVGKGARIELMEARDSSLLGAAVAVACEERR
ncbi:hypothetical protein jhhlp_003105 [Lomentospora prolificans]|uniref:Phosphotransferase n=1 Tax=Lomentospora prolificans TaxID=41688 RepID=A0A2N3NFY1_9PEZI|nr:hypothetical protein jhhlp_003105 [Lomentospora prolificans]